MLLPIDGTGGSDQSLFSAQPKPGGAILHRMKVEEIAEAIAKLPPDQLARFRRWFTAFEARPAILLVAVTRATFVTSSRHWQPSPLANCDREVHGHALTVAGDWRDH